MELPPQITPMTCSLTRKTIVILQSHSLVLFVLREDLRCFCIPGAGSCSKCISEALSAIMPMDTKTFSSLNRAGETLGLSGAEEPLMPKSHWRTDLVCFYSQPLLQTNTSVAKVRLSKQHSKAFWDFVSFSIQTEMRSQGMCQWPGSKGRETALDFLRSWK